MSIILGALAAGAGAISNSRASRRATAAQERAAQAGIDYQTETRDLTRQDLAPFRDAGLNALSAYNYEMGLGARPDDYTNFQGTPGFQFAMDQGLGAVEASAAGRGGLYSGSTMQALQERGMQLGNQEYGTHLNRLAQLAGSGQNASAGLAAANQNSANAITGLYGQQGNAQAAGAIAQGNATSGFLNNLSGAIGYQAAQGQNILGGPIGSWGFGS